MKIKVLIVEDEILIAMDIKNTIEKLGHEVIDTVTNCDDALKSIQRELPDLLFVDINLGKNKKMELIQFLKFVKTTISLLYIFLHLMIKIPLKEQQKLIHLTI